ncbi:MAG: ABC-2 transporter permease [Ruminococcus flavefaciens]|nr:ABC-2 transporter permease [Ruminococcus flavefaciens]
MGGLIYKDFLVNKKSIFIALGAMLYCGIMMIIPVSDESVKEDMGMFMQLYGILLFVAMFIISGAFEGNIFKSDESKKWAYFITSTPMLKKHIEAKYWLVMIMSLATMFIISVFDALNCIISDTQSLQALIMLMFCIQIFMRAIEIPFLVRFGDMGRYYKVGVFLLLVIIVGIYLLFGDLSHFGSIDSFYEWLFKALGGEVKALQIFVAVLPFVAFGAYYLSYRVSCRLYLKGAENFEK